MAKQIEDIVVQLGIKGFEELNKLRSSFRELTKVTKGTDEQLDDARKRLLELKTELGDTARANKGLTDAFTALVGEAKRGSTVWQDLNRDLSKLRQEARLTDTQITALRDIIIDESKVHAQSAVSIREHIKSLQDLRNQASLNGKVHQQLGADIQKLTATLEEGAVSNRKHYSSLTQILGVKPDAVLRQWEAYTRILQEGTASADKLAVAQRRLNQLSGAPRILERRRITSSAEITQDPEYLRRFGFEGASLPTLPNTNAAYAQQIKELQQDLQHLDRSSIQYLQTVMQLAGVQRQATEVIRGYAQALVMGLDTKVVERSSRNLQEAITALRAEMQQLDTTTAEGSATYAANANSVRNLEQELKKLGDSYRHVGDMATQAATAEQNAANARIRNNYLNRSLVAQQEQALVDLGQRVRAGVSGTPLLLPAAGQTSALGTGLQISGGARIGRATGAIQQIFAPGSGVGGVRFPGEQERLQPAATAEEADRARRTYITETDARRANAEAVEQQRQRMETLRAAVDKATKANTGSINSLANLREALANLRNELPATDKNFKQLTNRLQDVDQRANRLSTNVGRELTGMQLAQGVGAALSGGIFGGPEGLIGGLGGLAVGGVGGAFAGAAFGAQVGMFRQQLGAVTEYSARIDKLQIALRGIVGSQDAYSQALAAAASVTRDLNIPQESAIQGMTRLSAAVKGAGGTVTDSAFAFRAISEAVKATGGDAEQADGALLALTQVFSKGKVSAEELNQIAERLPGTFTLFAKAAGKTGPELQKALQEGQVGLNDLMKFLQLLSTNYGQTALKIAASSQDAGARLSVAMKQMQLDVGRALQPIGASLQSAFADFITKITPGVVAAMKGIAAAFEFLIENKTASGLATFALQLGTVTAGLIALRNAMASITAINLASLFASTAASAKITGDVLATTAVSAGGLAGRLAALRVALVSLASAAAKPVVITVLLAGIVEAINRINQVRRFFAEANQVSGQTSGAAWLKSMGGSALTRSQLSKLAEQNTAAFNFNTAELRRLQQQKQIIESQLGTVDDNVSAAALSNQLTGITTGIRTAETRIRNTRANLNEIYTALNRPQVTAAGGVSTFPSPEGSGEGTDDKARAKAERDAQAAAAEQQRLANNLFDQQINAEDRLFEHRIALDRQRYELQKRLDDLQTQNRIMRETGIARDIRSNFEDLQRGLREITERRMDAEAAVARATQAQQSAQARAVFAEAGATSLSGSSATRYIPKEQLREWLIKQGFGRTTGDFTDKGHATPRHTLNAMDMGILGGSDARALQLTGAMERRLRATGAFGNQLFGPISDPYGHGAGKGGQNIHLHIPTPEGKVLLTPGLASLMGIAGGGPLPTGAAAQQGRAIKAGGGAAIEALDLTQAKEQQKLIEGSVAQERAALFEQFTLKATDALRQQNVQLSDNNELQKVQNRLRDEGVSPERIELETRITEQRREQNRAQEMFNTLMADPNADKELLITTMRDINALYERNIELLTNASTAQTAYNNSIGGGFRDGAQAYIQSIGTMREATSQLAQTGIKGIEDAIFSLVTTGTANFREFAKQILENTARMIIQQLILRSVMQIIGAIGGGGGSTLAKTFEMPGAGFPTSGFKFANGGAFASNGIVPFAMGGVVKRPTMFAFANGGAGRLGLMGEAGPEAIMPLRRLPSGRLGVEAAGGGNAVKVDNITINVENSGEQLSPAAQKQIAGQVRGIVLATLVDQRRGGGVLR